MARRAYRSIQEYLQETGTTQKEAAEKCDLLQPTFNRYANRKSRPRPEVAKRIASTLNVSLTSLLMGDVA